MASLSPLRDIMNDEVTRLRQLRKSALKLRALASSLDAGKHASGIYEHASVLNWRIARIATGKLRSHPYRSYQRDPGFLETGADGLQSYLKATLANLRGRGMDTFLEEMSAALRQLDDARSLTLSTDLSDALGRAQLGMRMLIDEIRVQIARDSGQAVEDYAEQAAPRLAASPAQGPSYLAL
jgi:hypothetical protein